MGRYVKLPPSAVERININGTPLSKKAPKHPDGWYLCLPAHCASLWDRDRHDTFEQAVEAAGGIILDEEQAFESQRGNLRGRGDAEKSDQSMTSASGNETQTQTPAAPEAPSDESTEGDEGEDSGEGNADTEGSEEGGDA